MKVLFHIDEEEKWNIVLENVKNMLSYGKVNNTEFIIEVIANGKAVFGLLKTVSEESGWYQTMEELSEKSVSFFVCNNSLNKFIIDRQQLCKFASAVPAGVVEIAQKQKEGYSYIKP